MDRNGVVVVVEREAKSKNEQNERQSEGVGHNAISGHCKNTTQNTTGKEPHKKLSRVCFFDIVLGLFLIAFALVDVGVEPVLALPIVGDGLEARVRLQQRTNFTVVVVCMWGGWKTTNSARGKHSRDQKKAMMK